MALAALFLSLRAAGAASSDPVLLRDDFTRPDGLITNEHAYWNPAEPGAVVSSTWQMTSGSLFASSGTAWTGVPDAAEPDAASSNGTNSAVFRLETRRADFADVAVSFRLLNVGLSSAAAAAPADWDGVHVWLRYQDQRTLYYASINRRDGTVVIKKKIPPGSDNGGTYHALTPYLPHPVPYGRWQDVRATVRNDPDGSVTIQLFGDGALLASATDDGTVGGPPLRAPGRVGIRGDHAQFFFDDFTVSGLPPR